MANWSHKGGKKRGFVVQFNRAESFRDIYNGEHFGILQERELFFDRRNGVHGSVDRFVYRLAGIYTYPDVSLGFSFTSMFDNQSVGCTTGLITPR